MFTTYGQVVDVHFSDNNVFVRYKSKTVAAIALRALIMDYNICAHNRDIEKYLKKERYIIIINVLASCFCFSRQI